MPTPSLADQRESLELLLDATSVAADSHADDLATFAQISWKLIKSALTAISYSSRPVYSSEAFHLCAAAAAARARRSQVGAPGADDGLIATAEALFQISSSIMYDNDDYNQAAVHFVDRLCDAISWLESERSSSAAAHLSQLSVDASTAEVLSAAVEILSWRARRPLGNLNAVGRSAVLAAARRYLL